MVVVSRPERRSFARGTTDSAVIACLREAGIDDQKTRWLPPETSAQPLVILDSRSFDCHCKNLQWCKAFTTTAVGLSQTQLRAPTCDTLGNGGSTSDMGMSRQLLRCRLLWTAQPGVLPAYRYVLKIAPVLDIGAVAIAELYGLMFGYGKRHCPAHA